MARLLSSIAIAIGACATAATITPLAQAQTLPGGSVVVPPIEPIGVPVPAGSSATQLPVLSFPLFWQELPPPPPPPRYVASNWVEAGTWCPAPNQWAYSQNGTKLWCVRLQRTDGYQWAPHQTEIPWTPEASGPGRGTSVGNSLGGKPCGREGEGAIDPSNGQPAYCGLRMVGGPALVWMYRPGT